MTELPTSDITDETLFCRVLESSFDWLSSPILVTKLILLTFLNTLRPRQNGRSFPDDIFKWISLKENVWISINISLKFVPKGPINNIPTLVQIMAWRRPGDKPLSEPMMVSLPTHKCVARPQWVKKVTFRLSQLYLTNHTFFTSISAAVGCVCGDPSSCLYYKSCMFFPILLGASYTDIFYLSLEHGYVITSHSFLVGCNHPSMP